ncbi:unnamed protein product, partial [Closterium sp. Naga37s-1]
MHNRNSAPSRPAPPPAVRAGDRVSIVAPAGAVDARLLRQGCDVLASWGLVPVVHPQVALRQAYLAGSDRARAAGLVEAFLDPTTRAVVCARGGYGCARLLPLLERALRGEGQGEAEGKGEGEWERGGWECGDGEAELERGAEAVLGEGGAANEGRGDEDGGDQAKGNERGESWGTGGEGKGEEGEGNEGGGESGEWAQRLEGRAGCGGEEGGSGGEEGGSGGEVMWEGEDGVEGRADARGNVESAGAGAAGGDGGCRGVNRTFGSSADVARCCSSADVAQGGSRRSRLVTQICRKRFFGFSDVTALHRWGDLPGGHTHQAELAAPFISFHAPMPATSFFMHQSALASRAALRATLFEPSLPLACPPLQGRCLQRGWLGGASSCCRSNRVQGRLLGGNLSVLASLVGSKWAAGRRGTCCCSNSSGGGGAGGSDGVILMLEDVGEEEYRVDRMLHQLLPSLLPSAPPPCHATTCTHSHPAAHASAHVAAAQSNGHADPCQGSWKGMEPGHSSMGPDHHDHASSCSGMGHGTQGYVTALSGLVLGSFSNFQGMSDEARESVRPIVAEQYGGDWDKWFWLGQVALPYWLPVLAGLPIGHTSDNRVAPIGALVELDVETATLTVWAWYGYDAAVAGFYSAALPIFFPLLLVALASEFAWQHAASPQPPACSADVTSDCLQCVPGKGMQLQTSAGYTEASIPGIPMAGGGSINPVSFATAMLGVSVLFEVAAFVTVGPLADFGRGRKQLLQVGTYMGGAACLLCLVLASPTLWWLSALLLVVANVGYGIATVAYYSYLAVLVDASPEVQQAEAAGLPVQAVVEMREQVENRLSLTAVACASAASIAVTLLALAATLPTSSPALKLRLAVALCGAWWILLALPTFAFLKARPGPALPPGSPLRVFSGWRHLGAILAEARRYRNAFAFLVCYFVYADGYTTIMQIGVLFGQRELCLSTTATVLLACCVFLFALLGTPLAFWLQRVSGLHNKAMVCVLIAGMIPLPLWGLLGYLTPDGGVGLKSAWELYVFAGWFGVLLGPLSSYSRTLFIDMIPVGREGAFFSLYSVSDKGSSWLGPFIVAVIVQ